MLPTPLEVIEAHLAWLRASGLYAPTTIRDATRCLFYAHANLPNGLVRAARVEIEAFLGRDDWSKQTRATYGDHMRRFFAWGTDEDDPWLSLNPMARVRRPKVARGVPHPATDDQVRVAVNDLPMPFLLHARLAAYAGFRCIEVARACREHMDERDIRVFGKGDKPAILPQHPAIWQLVARVPPAEGWRQRTALTWNSDGTEVTENWVSGRTAIMLRRAGVNATMHQLRAWYITMIQRTYRDATVTRRLARHESLNTTQGYVLVADEACRDAVAGLPDLTDR